MVPLGALVLTVGVDVQDDRLECDVRGWTVGFSSWLVDHVVILGSPQDREPWDELARLLARDWPRQSGGAMRIARFCVDTGGGDTAAVYGQLRRLRNPCIAPTKGVNGWNRAQPVQSPTVVDALVNGQKLRRDLKLWTVSVSTRGPNSIAGFDSAAATRRSSHPAGCICRAQWARNGSTS